MAYFINFTELNSPEIQERLSNIPKCPGTCFFIDVVNSTGIKHNNSIEYWGRILNNTFNFISILKDLSSNIIKGIGDEIMVYIPDKEMAKHTLYNDYFSILWDLFYTIENLKNIPLKDDFLTCKAGIHYCEDAYNITFLKDVNDYYGKDIDLTARLMSKTKANRIVVSEVFYKKIRQEYENTYKGFHDKVFKKISEKYIEDFKGFPYSTEFRVIDV